MCTLAVGLTRGGMGLTRVTRTPRWKWSAGGSVFAVAAQRAVERVGAVAGGRGIPGCEGHGLCRVARLDDDAVAPVAFGVEASEVGANGQAVGWAVGAADQDDPHLDLWEFGCHNR